MKKLSPVVSNDLEPILSPTMEKPPLVQKAKPKNHMKKNKQNITKKMITAALEK